MIFFNNCDVRINGTGVMAKTASVSTANSVTAQRSMGKNLAVGVQPDGPYANEIKLTYLLEIDKDPVFANLLDFINLQHNTTNPNYEDIAGRTLSVGGITGTYYLNTYNVSIGQNVLIKASCTYVSFVPSTGELRKRSEILDYADSYSGLAHSWTSRLSSDDGDLEMPIYDFSYSFNGDVAPVFVLGQKFPKQVMLQTAEETISVTKEDSRLIDFHGESGWVLFSGRLEDGTYFHEDNNPFIKVEPLSGLCEGGTIDSISFPFSGMKIESSDTSIDTNDYARTTFLLKRYH
jgi:hypothetical protein